MTEAGITENEGNLTTVEKTHYDPDTGSVTVAVTRALARARGEDPATMHPVLYEAVAPDALEAFVTHATGTDWSLTVPVDGYTVCIAGDGQIRIQASQ